MAGVNVTIPGDARRLEAEAALMDQAVQYHWNMVTASSEQKVRRTAKSDEFAALASTVDA